ncbi:MAG: hydantoinase B/oxoprolinase family protein [Nannocystaceae bacterium]|nr:hydantoinase B/oxoprolinase family protein [Nannocystaceae bacterium]
MAAGRWRFFVDRGGTFTDCVALPPGGGAPVVCKLLSTDDAPLRAIRTVLALGDDAPIPPLELRLGTTVATNALLERKGARCALVITRGFADLPVIGDQTRPDIFALSIPPATRLHAEVIEIDARADRDGRVLARPDGDALARSFEALRAGGCDSVAVAVAFGTRAPALEQAVLTAAREAGLRYAVASHEVSSQLGLLARTQTAIVDAYTTPLLRAYLTGLADALPGSTLSVMQSSGALAPVARIGGRDAILSGPAGGVLAVAALARRHGLREVIGFDMGGTSTDVTRVQGGEPTLTWETTTADVRVHAPMLDVHTIAAGGGSVCRIVDGRLRVGPDSVGAMPGPLCYGRGDGSPSLTDMNLVLGRFVGDRFALPLHAAPAHAALAQLAAQWGDDAPAPERIAAGFFRIAVDAMAEAITRVSVARGHDVRRHALVAFGGAAGQHACALARSLGIARVLLPPLAGALSAWGIAQAPRGWHGEADLAARVLDDVAVRHALAHADALVERGRAALVTEGERGTPTVHRTLELRYRGTQHTLPLPLDADDLRARFDDAHASAFGWRRDDAIVECVTVRVRLEVPSAVPQPPGPPPGPPPRPRRHQRVFIDERWHDAPVFHREDIAAGVDVHGPALVLDDTGTLVLEPGWSLAIGDDGTLLLDDTAAADVVTPSSLARDPITLEIFAHRFMSIAEQMGVVLRRTASSTNIRERLDFSCAVFDAEANLVANAPHLPVHLGAMGESVAAIARQHPGARDGDVFATNDPAGGGSHLPDITVVTPVFVDGALSFWVASRGHHADVGGITPGSMPPHAVTLAQEGVVLRGLPIVRGGSWREDELRAALAAGPWPARRPDENLADLQAQIAANRRGELLLHALALREGLPRVHAYMAHVQDQAAFAVGNAIAALGDGTYAFDDRSDDGTRIAVRLEIRDRTLAIDFTGTDAAVPNNANAPRAVTVAAVLYVLRTLVGQAIPLNRGCLRGVTLTIPAGSLLDPPPDAAVAAGNVETSQRVVDVLLAALGRKAASQGTMNNLTFGDGSFGYYETIGGGEGATADADGRDAVHTHMTNTRITDPEILEASTGVRVCSFAVRRGSGGRGHRRGGDGIVRELEFDRALEVSLLADRRVRPPFGLGGGEPGACGQTRWGARALPGRIAFVVEPGDRVIVETPGGGGFGPPDGDTPA